MFIRETKKQHGRDSKAFYQYSLVQAARIDGKARQRTILYLGSDSELKSKENRKMVLEVLSGLIERSLPMFDHIPESLRKLAESYYEKYKIKYDGAEKDPIPLPPKKDSTRFENIAVDRVEVAENKSFGPEHLCLQTLDKLKIGPFLSELGLGKEDIERSLISIASRAIYRASEYKTSQILDINSSLIECTGYPGSITHKQLYRISDTLYKYKEKIDEYLYNHITTIFEIEDRIVIFDISNTYFETRKADSRLTNYGRSKEKRHDCPIVVFTGVINADGFIRHSRIYEGNTPDPATLSDMVADLEQYSGSKEKTVVLDAGIATDENLKLLDEKGYGYVCVSRKRLKDYPAECLKDRVVRKTDRGNGEVALSIFTPQGYSDTWMLVESEAKKTKEQSMSKKLRKRFEQDLDTAKTALHKKGGTKNIDKTWERIGRLKQKHKHVSGGYKITISEKDGKATDITWGIKKDKRKEDKSKGIYFIRTNIKNPEESKLWDIYNTVRKVESTFRCLKTDLNIRPVHHKNDGRIEAHLYLATLAYQLVNTIRYMLGQAGINYDWRNILRIMSTQQVQTLQMPTETKTIYIRKASKPIMEAKQIYDTTGCRETEKTLKKYVVYH